MAITSIKTGSSFTNLVKYNDFLAGNPSFIPSSYESIATVTSTGGETSLSFTSIPQTYKHLEIRGIARASNGNTFARPIHIYFNNDKASWSAHGFGGGSGNTGVYAEGYSSTYATRSNAWLLDDGTSSGMFGAGIASILDYANTSKNKTISIFSGGSNNLNNTSGGVSSASGCWYSTAAITTITFEPSAGTWISGTTFSLYGIK